MLISVLSNPTTTVEPPKSSVPVLVLSCKRIESCEPSWLTTTNLPLTVAAEMIEEQKTIRITNRNSDILIFPKPFYKELIANYGVSIPFLITKTSFIIA